MNIRKRLLQEADEKYRTFSATLIPNINNLLGVRLPVLRKIAKEIAQSNWYEFLNSECQYMEEVMLQGMVIGLCGSLKDIQSFVPKIDNWSVCDSFCCSLKFISQNKSKYWEFLQQYLYSEEEYQIRFGLVILLNYFVEIEYLPKIFDILNKFSSKKYYAQMAAAWLISVCFVNYEQETLEFLSTTKLDNFTYNKSIQKIIESNKVDKTTKNKIRKMKRKG